MGKSQEKGGVASGSSGGSFAFWCSSLLEHQVYTEGSAQPEAGSLSLRVWAVGVMLGSTVGRLENILQWAKQTPFPTDTHAHTHMHTCKIGRAHV